jgi:hypothetical protein
MPPTITCTQISTNPDVFEVRDGERVLGTIQRMPYDPGRLLVRLCLGKGSVSVGYFNDWHVAGDALIAADANREMAESLFELLD